MGYYAREVRQSSTRPLKKSEFSIIFAKNSGGEKIRLPQISAPVNYDVTSAAKQKANGSYKCVYRK